MSYNYKINDDGTMLPYPIDTQLPQQSNLSKEIIIHLEDKLVIFKYSSEKSIFAIIRGSCHNIKHTYSLCRWNNIGGWKTIHTEEYRDINEALAFMAPMAKYFL